MNRFTHLTMTFAVAGGLALPVSALGAQAAQQTVVVVPFNLHEARRDSRDLAGVGTAVADLLAADLRAGGARVVERGPARRTAALQAHTRDGMLGRQGAVSAARTLGASHVVYGGFSADAAGNVRLDARAVNAATGAIEASERLQGSGDEVVAMLTDLASRLAKGMSLPLSSSQSPVAALPLRSLVDYGKGLDAADRGDHAQARQLLGGVVRDHPDFAPAKAALAASGER